MSAINYLVINILQNTICVLVGLGDKSITLALNLK